MTPKDEENLGKILEIQNQETSVNSGYEDKFTIKIREMLDKIKENPDDEKLQQEFETLLDEKIEKSFSAVEKLSNQEVPEPVKEIHEFLINAFEIYYDGLLEFKEYLFDKNEDRIEAAFEIIAEANSIFMNVDMRAIEMEKAPISTTA